MITLDSALSTGRGLERAFNCPVHDDKNASASVNVTKMVWYCYACNAHGSIKDHVPTAEDVLKSLEAEVPAYVYSDAWLDLFDADSPSEYWSKRYGEKTASWFRCGTDFKDGAPTYPVRYLNGNLVGVVRRYEDKKPKYMYPSGIKISTMLFGDIKPVPVIVLVEGAGDVMALHQSGIPDHWTVLGVYGAGLHYPQTQIISDLSPKVVLAAFDADNAGNAAASRAEQQLSNIAPVIKIDWSSANGKDPGEIPVSDRIGIISTALKNSAYSKHK